jgi:hypothetical protein
MYCLKCSIKNSDESIFDKIANIRINGDSVESDFFLIEHCLTCKKRFFIDEKGRVTDV